MKLVLPSPDRTTTTPSAVMTSLVTPAVAEVEVSTWRVDMPAGASSPVHVIDRAQVYLPVSGSFTFAVGENRQEVGAGEALVVEAGEERQFSAGEAGGAAVVVMPADGAVQLPDGGRMPVPWAR
ncbi:cupin domain-containing protein [Nakamurella sp. YIM 132087]|uniref:Cupin domain-containing protein n=1 Tax=Nakamurella alba TaxID=2665158 RepID=A0A7K1FKJ3_9ACTN|nr:cupin domain-containing protein [Nakamurella alba]MTD14662.1 cupin domain-containing protein [Nakamurella alba]